ncbi:M6 family metalloprotease domain-containing protein [Gemmatimonas aurantiaca]|nr:M6 family metalloprotease domain-containing protein [Gemmatimonas aurantiaca]
MRSIHNNKELSARRDMRLPAYKARRGNEAGEKCTTGSGSLSHSQVSKYQNSAQFNNAKNANNAKHAKNYEKQSWNRPTRNRVASGRPNGGKHMIVSVPKNIVPKNIIPKTSIPKKFSWLKTTVLALMIAHLNLPAFAVDFHPDVKTQLAERGELQSAYHALSAARHAGVCSPSTTPLRTPNMINKISSQAFGGDGAVLSGSLSTGAGHVDTVRVLVILVDFADNKYDASISPYVSNVSATIPMFDSVLFSTGNLDGAGVTNPSGSMTEYYMENSYGKFFVQGTVVGWYQMPRLYSEYVGSQNGLQRDGTLNAQDLAKDAINAADVDVNFADFDNFGPNGVPDGRLDGVFIVHAGTGNEESHLGGANDIHSHKWNLKSTISRDGIIIDTYSMEPEETYIGKAISPIGVFAHEYGHVLGLPDLYDTNGNLEPVEGSSDGIGVWSVMASGNYLGGSATPSHLDAWSKIWVGFSSPIVLTENLRDVQIPQASDSAVCYKLVGENLPNGEYFLVENRQRNKFDINLPNGGILVYHIDEAFNNPLSDNNNNETRYLVALEQADGKNDLALTLYNDGDAGDPFSANINYTEFTDMTSPNSKSNGTSSTTEVAVWNISALGPMMTANLDISFSRPYLSIAGTQFYDLGDGDLTLEAGEEFELDIWVDNLWATGVGGYVLISSPSQDLSFSVDSIFLGDILGDGGTTGTPSPLVFTVANSLEPSIDSLFFAYHSDNGENVTTLALEIEIGAPNILIVNSDKKGKHGEFYSGDLYAARKPSRMHTVMTEGAVPSALLNQFKTVIWFFGDTTTIALPAADVAAMKSYLDNGGNLMLTGQSLAKLLHNSDSAFMADYLYSELWADTEQYYARQEGIDGSPVGDGFTDVRIFGTNGAKNWIKEEARAVRVLEGAQPALQGRSLTIPPDAYHAYTFSGEYKLVFFSLPFEAIENVEGFRVPRPVILDRVLAFFDGLSTDVEEGFFDEPILPDAFTLSQNYPNPFNPSTTINYSIDRNLGSKSANYTELSIFNILGQEVRVLVSEIQGPGQYSVFWDGLSSAGAQSASGIYLYRLKRGEVSQSKKMVLLK